MVPLPGPLAALEEASDPSETGPTLWGKSWSIRTASQADRSSIQVHIQVRVIPRSLIPSRILLLFRHPGRYDKHVLARVTRAYGEINRLKKSP